jgi:hypothetical protein
MSRNIIFVLKLLTIWCSGMWIEVNKQMFKIGKINLTFLNFTGSLLWVGEHPFFNFITWNPEFPAIFVNYALMDSYVFYSIFLPILSVTQLLQNSNYSSLKPTPSSCGIRKSNFCFLVRLCFNVPLIREHTIGIAWTVCSVWVRII